ncbi:hypothetical protein [Azospirillum sp.]|uniref:hypothetical protein n=1 Tax=Azospirillum sp. TaxID=34012 RepID=UPI002D317FB4|nr:hypothetical protein [Azospirillum sp.]HYD65961.1 hypothetical protein [Azospirillum sp.]
MIGSVLGVGGRAERWLLKLIDVSDVIFGIVSFSIIVNYKLEVGQYFGWIARYGLEVLGSGWLFRQAAYSAWMFLSDKGYVIILSIVTIVWYVRYRSAVKNEYNILLEIYLKAKIPMRVRDLEGANYIPLLSIGLALGFVLMGFVVDNIQAFCIVAICINVLDLRGNLLIIRNMSKFLSLDEYKPADGDPIAPYIYRRRVVADKYWVKRPQIERVGVLLICNCGAFLISGLSDSFGEATSEYLAVLMASISILGNEVLMANWRHIRDKEFAEIDREEEEFLERLKAATAESEA